MILKSITLLNYRNLSDVSIELSSKINCFIGSNGMGKTNLLDAIYYLSFCKSALSQSDTFNIQHEEPFFMIQGNYTSDSGVGEEVSCALKRGEKKQIKRNKKTYDRFSDHIGTFPLVMVSPADNELIAGGSEERRRFMDLVISQYDRNYLASLIRYNRSLQQRNSLLRGEKEPDAEMLSLIEEMMSIEAEVVREGRRNFLEQLLPIFENYHRIITGGKEQVGITYKANVDGDFRQHLAASRSDDRRMGYTTKGVHRDDLTMTLGGYPIKKEGSQGQNKSLLLALKLAQYNFLYKCSGEKPLLLLDDIFDKLDAGRVERMLSLVAGDEFGQIFITDVNREHTDGILEQVRGNYRLFEVVQGGVSLVKESGV